MGIIEDWQWELKKLYIIRFEKYFSFIYTIEINIFKIFYNFI